MIRSTSLRIVEKVIEGRSSRYGIGHFEFISPRSKHPPMPEAQNQSELPASLGVSGSHALDAETPAITSNILIVRAVFGCGRGGSWWCRFR